MGDDKLLLRIDNDSRPELAALVHTFNLDPQMKRWFPEAGGIATLPTYSPFSDKRRVPIEQLWPHSTDRTGRPTHIMRISRRDGFDGVNVSSIEKSESLSTLLHQTVIPKHAEVASGILSTIVRAASGLRGLSVEIGQDAYDNPDCLAVVEKALNDR
jgi:hypothetical protein